MLKKLLFIGFCFLSLLDFLASFDSRLDLLSHFKLQFCLGICIGILAYGWKKSWILVCIGLFTLGIHLTQIIPWYIPAQNTAAPTNTKLALKILLANVYFDNHQTLALETLVTQENPDLVILQEAHKAQIEMMDALEERYPFSFRPPQNNPFGLALWSKYSFENPQFLLLADAELPSLKGSLKISGHTLNLFTTHLSSPIRKPAIHRNRQLKALGKYLQGKENYLVLGDFNTSMWSPYYKAFEKETGLKNCRKGFGILPSWPAQIPSWARIPIDQCLVSQSLDIQSMHVGTAIGSDHLPLLIEVSLANQ